MISNYKTMNAKENHPGWGGKRPGSGRPKTGKKANPFSFRMDMDVADILSEKENRSVYINQAVREKNERDR